MLTEKLMKIQSELKAPKNQTNTFGKYKYRSCEDIMEAVKPLLAKYKAVLTVSDTIEQFGDRYYIKAVAKLSDTEGTEEVTTSAYARESLDKKGMDDSQITGSTSSYARKYALNGLFAIDDTKDADSTNDGKEEAKPEPKKPSEVYLPLVSDATLADLTSRLTNEEVDITLAFYKIAKLGDLTEKHAKQMIEKKKNDAKKTTK